MLVDCYQSATKSGKGHIIEQVGVLTICRSKPVRIILSCNPAFYC